MADVAIKVENLSKVYKIFDNPLDRVKEALHPFHKRYSKDFYALRDVSFEVRKGETIGIIGKNGAGKSTLLKIITGVLTPTEGNVQVHGRIASLLELGAGFNPEMTGIENIYLNGTVMGYSKEEMDKRLPDIVAFADIGDFISQPVKMYSSGMFARLAFAVNAFVEPDILIVDEALSVGDMKFQIKCMDRMKELINGGCTILFVSHDINAVRRLCDRAVWLDLGHVAMINEVNFVADNYIESLQIVDSLLENSTEDVFRMNKKLTTENSNDIAQIIDFVIKDKLGFERKQFMYNELISVEIEYIVRDCNIKNAVIGVALFDINDKYICGLNTLLDHITVPWKYGRNKVCLQYDMGILALGGNYYFDVAIEDQTASVMIHYVREVEHIVVKSNYVSEGIYTIPHQWKC